MTIFFGNDNQSAIELQQSLSIPMKASILFAKDWCWIQVVLTSQTLSHSEKKTWFTIFVCRSVAVICRFNGEKSVWFFVFISLHVWILKFLWSVESYNFFVGKLLSISFHSTRVQNSLSENCVTRTTTVKQNVSRVRERERKRKRIQMLSRIIAITHLEPASI